MTAVKSPRMARWLAASVLAVVAASASGVAVAESAGEVVYSQGVGTVQQPGQTRAHLMGKGVPVAEGDTITTAANSYAILKLSDGTQMTVRPDTQMVIQTYQFKSQTSESENAGSMVFNLLRGGLRTITGLIPKRDASAARVRTPSATVGIRGTDFDMRICQGGCEGNQAGNAAKGAAPRSNFVFASARMVDARGEVHTRGADGARHILVSGGPIYPGDTVETGAASYAVLAFRDESKVTLQPNTNFRVEDFVYDAKKPDEGRFLVNLVKGGLRAFTGLIGKTNHDHVGVRTPTATVGIRGTGIDLLCQGTCSGDAATATLDGTTITVWDGSVSLTPGGFSGAPGSGGGAGGGCGGVDVGTGQSGSFKDCATGAKVVDEVLVIFDTPRPDQVPVDWDRLFGFGALGGGESGLWVNVRKGPVSIETANGTLELGDGETGYSNGIVLIRPAAVPLFLDQDTTPLPTRGNGTGDGGAGGLHNLLEAEGVDASCKP